MPRLLMLCALALTALISTPALAGDPETCAYGDLRLSQACRTDRAVRTFLMRSENAGVTRYMDMPPEVRGWEPGEEEATIEDSRTLARQAGIGCTYPRTPLLALACERDPQARRHLASVNPGPNAIWFHLPPEIGGYPGSRFNEALLHRNSGANRQRFEWVGDVHGRERRAHTLGRTLSRAMNAEITVVKAHLIAVDGINFVACGYAFSNGGGYEQPSSGTFIFDTRTTGQNVYRATAEQFRARCLAADAVLL